MSFVTESLDWTGLNPERDIKSFTGQTGAEASLAGAQLQAESAEKGIALQRETRDQLLSILKPYMELGYGNIDRLQGLINQPGDQTALNAAASLMGVTRATPAVYEQPSNQLLNKTGQPVNQLTSDRRTIASTPNAAGRDVYGNTAITNNQPVQQPVRQPVNSADPLGYGAKYAHEQTLNQLQNAPPGGTTTLSDITRSGVPAQQPAQPVQQSPQPVQQATQPAQPRVIQEATPGSYTPVDRPILNQFNQTLTGGRDTAALNRLTSLATDPNAQASFINENPFYGALATDAERRLMANQAARGKVGSGGTAVGLQDSLVRLGSDLLQREIGNLSTADSAGLSSYQSNLGNLGTGVGLNEGIRTGDINQLLQLQGFESGLRADDINSILQLVGMGQNAAAGQGAGVQNTGNNITSLLSSIGDAQAAGGIGAANAYGQGSQNVASAATALAGMFAAMSDERQKKNKVKVGRLITDKGEYDYYTFDYWDGNHSQGVMAQQVEKINPEAVTEINGIKHVYYGRL